MLMAGGVCPDQGMNEPQTMKTRKKEARHSTTMERQKSSDRISACIGTRILLPIAISRLLLFQTGRLELETFQQCRHQILETGTRQWSRGHTHCRHCLTHTHTHSIKVDFQFSPVVEIKQKLVKHNNNKWDYAHLENYFSFVGGGGWMFSTIFFSFHRTITNHRLFALRLKHPGSICART